MYITDKNNTNYSHSNFSTLDYVLKEMAYGESKELVNFFKQLFSYGEDIIKEHNDIVTTNKNKQLEAIKNQFNKDLISLKEKEEQLKSLGIKLSNKNSFITSLGLINSNQTYYETFNGLSYTNFSYLTNDDELNIAKSDEKHYAKRKFFISSIKERKYLRSRKESLLLEKAELEKKLKLPFFKEKNKVRLEIIKIELYEIEKALNNYKNMFNTIKRYALLNDEQKESIIEYCKLVDEIDILSTKYNEALYGDRDKYYSDKQLTITLKEYIDKDIWYKALTRMFRENDISLEYLDKIFNQIEDSSNKWKDKSFEMRTSSAEDRDILKYKQLVSFFLDEIYNKEMDDVLTKKTTYSDLSNSKKLVK